MYYNQGKYLILAVMENDWILRNIRTMMKDKDLKMENFSRDIGISVGEFSKILNGQRKNYYDHLPKMAELLGVSFHELVKQDSTIIQNNHHQEGGTAMHNGVDQNYIDKLVEQCHHTIEAKDATIKILETLIQTEKDLKENFKRKYEILKARLIEADKKEGKK